MATLVEIMEAHGGYGAIEGETVQSKASKNKREISLDTRFDIFSRDKYKCRLCGRGAEDGVKLEIDHIVPKSKGGSDRKKNLWTLCFDCNRGKKAKIINLEST